MSEFRKQVWVLLLVLSFFGYSQNDETLIKSDFSAYLQAITDQEYEKSMDYMVEEVFDIVPREQMVTMMSSVMNTKEIDFKFGDFNIQSLQDEISIDEKSYVILDYVSDMSMKFNAPEGEEAPSEEDVKMQNMMILASFEVQFGKGNVTLNEETGFFDIKAIKKAVAIKKKDETSWKFIVVEKGQPFLLKQILPAEILEKVLTED